MPPSKVEEPKYTEDEPDMPPMGCGIMGKYPVLSVLVFAFAGIGIGVGMSYWEPDNMDDKDTALKWIGLIGDLFIRSLKAVVLPLVFVNVVLSVVDMMQIGRAGSIGWKTIALYILTTVVASIIGIISIVSFRSLFDQGTFEEDGPALVSLGCNADGSYLAEQADGSVMCSSSADTADSQFAITDVTSAFVKSSSGARNDISLSDTIYSGIFTKLVTANIFGAFNSANFAAVVMFAIFFGVALGRVMETQRMEGQSYIVSFFKELDKIFIQLINWIIMITPFAVLSLIIKAIGSREDLKDAFSNVGWLVVATILAMAFHFIIMHIGFWALVTKSNPITYLRCILPAQTMAFACASSAATIPMTLRSVRSTGVVPEAILRFVIPLGATINMDGGAIYFPCACIWMAYLNGIEPDVSSYFLLIIIATIGSAGTAPVPSASLVLIITAYNTVFNAEGTPDGFEFILAIDWFMDRLRTTLNVTGDAMVSGMVASLCPIDEEEDHEGSALKEAPLESPEIEIVEG
eukprot:CAMPEP_0202451292 /NCGR_PEP_ID=MMETSP1360-20130828/9756_1 /ASSEMBLY_ACC=CAM_ASM_000848 /TAXON_ID=515479 /ORGANISM="Licmophora paradoxa, Strain CCMP2313" /LENGTH=519 /DNA_ID=CAMNT_0049069829 /DNA_START=42 /DNA_END=1601 /DNA_ORIENTATION=-